MAFEVQVSASGLSKPDDWISSICAAELHFCPRRVVRHGYIVMVQRDSRLVASHEGAAAEWMRRVA